MKERLDVTMFERGMAASRQKAKEMITEGHVNVNGKTCMKPSFAVDSDADIHIIGETLKYVGRGGLKLESIISLCGISLEGKICMDIGASTGGFTDCMLQNGASAVYAVDVGSGQLAQKLAADSRVINMEKTDIRNISLCDLEKKPEFISADVSFISLKLILRKIYELLADNGVAAVLIKPQFEAGRENIGKNGIVKSRNVHKSVVADIISFSSQLGFSIAGICCSPITGSKGNIEYLMCLKKNGQSINVDVVKLVDDAFNKLKSGGKS